MMRNAREHPMIVVYTDDHGNTAYGNSVEGYRYFDNAGNPVSPNQVEPFRLAGTSFVIKHSLLGIEASEV